MYIKYHKFLYTGVRQDMIKFCFSWGDMISVSLEDIVSIIHFKMQAPSMISSVYFINFQVKKAPIVDKTTAEAEILFDIPAMIKRCISGHLH